jgi:hypothetical protein
MSFVKLGALWLKKLDDGREFTNGVITIDGKETRISLLPNKFKTEARHPDWILVLDERGAGGNAPAPARTVSRFGRPAPAPAPARTVRRDDPPVYEGEGREPGDDDPDVERDTEGAPYRGAKIPF